MTRNIFYLAIIVLVALFLRLWHLSDVPNGMTNDEAGYIYSAYSIWKTGHDVVGNFLPLSINLDNSFSPVYIYVTAPFVGIFGLTPFFGRLPFALVSIGVVYLIYLLVQLLFKNDRVALLSAAVIAVSPWHLQLSRGSWDAAFSMFFYLLGIYLFIRFRRNKKIFFSLLAFLLAFYSYHATKIYFIFLVPLLAVLYWREIGKRNSMLFISGCFLILFSFLYISKTQQVTRSEVLLFNSPDTAKTVNWEREKNTAPFFLREVFNNKPLYYLRVLRENYLEAFSTNFLFLYGETGGLGGQYGLFDRGELYIIELPFLILGVLYLLKQKNKKVSLLLFGLLFIAPIPSAVSLDKTYVSRSSMMVPILTIIIGTGIYYCTMLIKPLRKHYQIALLSLTFIIYVFLIFSYLYQYYFRYPVYSAESWFYSTKQLSEYLIQQKDKYSHIYIADAGKMFLMQYGIYNQIDPKIVQSAWKQETPQIENISFMPRCLQPNIQTPAFPSHTGRILYIVRDSCYKSAQPIDKIVDRGEPLRTIWKIYEAK